MLEFIKQNTQLGKSTDLMLKFVSSNLLQMEDMKEVTFSRMTTWSKPSKYKINNMITSFPVLQWA